ncbi:MAG: hypothetical protein E7164_00265 [Firmicutes bacterium]|nr:hypothetical protein [Bacillota bacterium]
MKKKKKGNWFFRILTVFFIIYVALFISLHTGYYEKTVRDRTLMTEEKIKQFEEDVANNMVVDIKDYLPNEEDYSNIFTKSAISISSTLGNILDSKAENFWDFIKSLFIS